MLVDAAQILGHFFGRRLDLDDLRERFAIMAKFLVDQRLYANRLLLYLKIKAGDCN